MANTPTLPTAQVTLTIEMPLAVVIDIHQFFLAQQASGAVAFLGADVAATDTTITVAGTPVTGSAPATIGTPANVQVGSTICVGNEPMSITAVNGNVWTVARYPAIMPYIPIPPTQQHTAGAAVALLAFPDPATLICNAVLMPWAQNTVIPQLRQKSATFGSSASLTLTVVPQ